ncbi:MAG: MFS transporter [Acidimicrobiaceae bacterium]|jgi:MFS family permease
MAETGPPDTIFSGEKRGLTIAVMASIGIIAYSNLGLTAALPDIGNDLGDVALLPWTITVELLMSGVAVLAAGPVVDGLGTRRVFRWSVVGFVITSALCGLAPTMLLLVIGRALQGITIGVLLTSAMAAIGLSYPVHQRARVFAMNSTVWGVMSVAGPSIAAVMVATLNWRGVFFFSVPVGLVAGALAWNNLPGPTSEARTSTADVRGIGIVAVIAAAGLAVAQGSLTAIAGGTLVVALGVFGYARHARSVPDPVVRPRHLFATRFRSVHTTSLLAVGGALGFHSFLPVYLNGVRGLSTTAAAFSVAYLSAGWTTGAVSSSRLQDRILREQVVLIGSVVLSIGILLSTVLVWAEAPVAVLAIGLFISGLGTGAISTTGINVLQERTPLSEMGRVNGAHQFTRSMSVTYGVGIAGAVILTTVDRRTGDVEAVRDLLGGDVETVSRPVADALGAGFLFAIAVAAVAAVTTIPAARHLVRSRPEAVTSAA